jgi:hypothetical protein
MAMDQTSKFCRRCNKHTLHARPGTNHLAHALVTLFLCGFWLPIWILASLKIGGWKCQTCGYGGSPLARVGLAMVCIVFFFTALVAVLSSNRPSVQHYAQQTPQAVSQPRAQPQPEPKHYQKIRTQAKSHFVWIDPQYKCDPNVYEQAIAEIAGDERNCIIFFWDDRSAIPAGTPFTDEQTKSQVAQYERNRTTGHERFFFLRNGDIVEPFGNRPSTTPIPGTKPTPTPKPLEPDYRTWTDSTGTHKTEAKFGGMAFGKVKLIKRNGSTVQVPLEKLSDEDREWIAKRQK